MKVKAHELLLQKRTPYTVALPVAQTHLARLLNEIWQKTLTHPFCTIPAEQKSQPQHSAKHEACPSQRELHVLKKTSLQ